MNIWGPCRWWVEAEAGGIRGWGQLEAIKVARTGFTVFEI